MMAFVTTVGDLMKIQQNLHIRPTVDIKPGPEYSYTRKRWWKYAISAVVEEKKSKLDFLSAFKKYSRFKNYVSYYKRQKKFVKSNSNSNPDFID